MKLGDYIIYLIITNGVNRFNIQSKSKMINKLIY